MPSDGARRVTGNTLVSDRMPAIEVTVAEAFTYVGDLRFVLGEVAQVEAFLFIAQRRGAVSQLVVVQFEGYLDGQEGSYDYPSTRLVTLDRHPYQADTFIQSLTPRPPPASDVGRLIALLEERGYALPPAVLVQRFVRVLGAAKRAELLISVVEPLDDADLIAAVARAGQPVPAPSGLARAAERRALASFAVVDLDSAVAPEP